MSSISVARRARTLLKRTYDFNNATISKSVIKECERAVRDALRPYRDDLVPYMINPLVMETISRLAQNGYLRGGRNARPAATPQECYQTATSITDEFKFILYAPTPHDQASVIQQGATSVVDALFRSKKLVPLIA